MSSNGSRKIVLMGGLAGALIGLALTVAWQVWGESRAGRDAVADGVRTLSPDDAPAGTTPRLSDRADALSRIIEIRLRAGEYDRALPLLKAANELEPAERDRVYEDAADAVLRPASAGGANGEAYLAENGGKEAVGRKLGHLSAIEQQLPAGPAKVKLLLRMRNVYDILGLNPDEAEKSGGLPGRESLLTRATSIATALPAGPGRGWHSWLVGGYFTTLLAGLGVVFTWMGQEYVKAMAEDFAKRSRSVLVNRVLSAQGTPVASAGARPAAVEGASPGTPAEPADRASSSA